MKDSIDFSKLDSELKRILHVTEITDETNFHEMDSLETLDLIYTVELLFNVEITKAIGGGVGIHIRTQNVKDLKDYICSHLTD